MEDDSNSATNKHLKFLSDFNEPNFEELYELL